MTDKVSGAASYSFRGLALILGAITLANLLVSERFFQLFSPRLLWLFVLAIIILIVLAWGYQAGRPNRNVPTFNSSKPPLINILLSILSFVFATFVNVPIGPNKEVSLHTVLMQPATMINQEIEVDTLRRNVLDWSHLISLNSDAHALDEMTADVIGIAFHDEALSHDQILLTRMRVSGTVQTGQFVAIVAQLSDARNVRDGSWIRLIGQFEADSVAGTEIPVLIASELHIVQQPEHPYLFP